MNAFLVIDEEDTTRNTAIVNGLHDPVRRRFVVHVPVMRQALPAEILSAIRGRAQKADSPKTLRTAVDAWIVAVAPADLILYGAWRLHDADTRWLVHAAEQSPGTNVWFVTHAGARSFIDSTRRRCASVWSFRLWARRWRRTRIRRPKTRATEPDLERFGGPCRPTDPPSQMLPWPWGMHAAFYRRGGRGRRLIGEYRALSSHARTELRTNPSPLRVAFLVEAICRRFPDQRRRAFALHVLTDLVCRDMGIFLRWQPAVEAIRLRQPPETELSWAETSPVRPLPSNPLDAGWDALTQLASADELDEVVVSEAAAEMITSSGRRTAIPDHLRADVRACLAAGSSVTRHHSYWVLQRPRISTMDDIARTGELLTVRPLQDTFIPAEALRDAVDAVDFSADPEPADLSFEQASILYHLSAVHRTYPVSSDQSYFTSATTPADAADLAALLAARLVYVHGLPQAQRAPVSLADWLYSVWCRNTPARPPVPPEYESDYGSLDFLR